MFTIENTLDNVKVGTIAIADQIQKGKKQFVTTFVTNNDYAKTMNDFVDAQTEYTITAINTGFDSVKSFLQTTADYVQESTKYMQPAVAKKSK